MKRESKSDREKRKGRKMEKGERRNRKKEDGQRVIEIKGRR